MRIPAAEQHDMTVTIHPGQPSHGKLRTDLLPVEWKD